MLKKEGQAEENNTWQKGEGEETMKVDEGLKLSDTESLNLSKACNGFDDEMYKNHGLREEGESIGEFLLKGSNRIKDYPVIRGMLKEI